MSGRFGSAIKLDGTSAYGNFNIDPPENNCTYEMRYKPTDFNSASWVIMGWGSYNGGITVSHDSIVIPYYSNSKAFTEANEWYYIALALSTTDSLRALYVNGVKICNLPAASNTQTWNSLWLGDYRGGGGYHAFNNGTIDEIRISNVARTSAEISTYWLSNQ